MQKMSSSGRTASALEATLAELAEVMGLLARASLSVVPARPAAQSVTSREASNPAARQQRPSNSLATVDASLDHRRAREPSADKFVRIL